MHLATCGILLSSYHFTSKALEFNFSWHVDQLNLTTMGYPNTLSMLLFNHILVSGSEVERNNTYKIMNYPHYTDSL